MIEIRDHDIGCIEYDNAPDVVHNLEIRNRDGTLLLRIYFEDDDKALKFGKELSDTIRVAIMERAGVS